jgi:hypothetical protein
MGVSIAVTEELSKVVLAEVGVWRMPQLGCRAVCGLVVDNFVAGIAAIHSRLFSGLVNVTQE